MTSFEYILKNFYFEPLNENKFPKFGKAGKQEYLFVCKRCKSQSEPMKFDLDVKYMLASHLVKNCKPSNASNTSEQEEQQQQGPAAEKI